MKIPLTIKESRELLKALAAKELDTENVPGIYEAIKADVIKNGHNIQVEIIDSREQVDKDLL